MLESSAALCVYFVRRRRVYEVYRQALQVHMAPAGVAANLSFEERYAHLIDPNRKWYNNRRCECLLFGTSGDSQCNRLIILNAWLVLMYVRSVIKVLSDTVQQTFFSLITSTANGFDNSLMNSFQSLNQWNDYFHHPTGGKLGVLNAIQVHSIVPCPASSNPLCLSEHWVARLLPSRAIF